ncbi:30S ribosome-binding factor RbfA [Haloimpatiens lingqiaonensis]|uniref:30S ribosome-binding factor RbfA n=1 Tax=Haloimpatiens lingqiaonensis TaxID=1380675 RepID=UPI0010FDE0B4|nr:30S ribosome-binding factor RbfA [Haloimpatiens lingqiaonensis]
MGKYRAGRINEELKREISSIIQNDIKDPRVGTMISVTDVNVTKDLRYAKVYVSIFGEESEKEETLQILRNSSGFIRGEVGRRVNLRHTPEIILEMDNSIEHGMYIDSLLEKIKEQGQNDNE